MTDVPSITPSVTPDPDGGHPRPAPRRALRLALTLARDSLTSPHPEFRAAVQEAILRLLDEPPTAIPSQQDRLVELQQITRALAAPHTLRCALCEEVMSPGEGHLVPVANGHVASHDDLTHCVLLDLSLQLRRWVAAHPFDDDQDPALDTSEQRLIRAYHRFAALLGDADGASFMRVSYDVCATVGYSNTDCWACVAHWQWMAPGLRRKRVEELIRRTPTLQTIVELEPLETPSRP